MKVIGFNGSPRKDWNTATLVKEALNGAKALGAETELIHLYDLNFKGCVSCFNCKLKGGKDYGICSQPDELKPILDKILKADGLILGSPFYISGITGVMKSFLERLVFPYLVYSDSPRTLFPKKIKVILIHTFGAAEEIALQKYHETLKNTETVINMILGETRSVNSYDTYQFEDYTKYEASRFDQVKKSKQRREVFPMDCIKAFETGKWLTE